MGWCGTRVVVYEWAGYLCSWGERRGRGCVPGQGQCYGEGSKPLVKATAWAVTWPATPNWIWLCWDWQKLGVGWGGEADSYASGDTLHRDVGWLFGVWGTLDVSHYPHPRMVPMGVTLWARTAYREAPSPAQGLGKAWRPQYRGRPQAGNERKPRGNMINDILSPRPSLSLSCLRKGCLCCTASTWSSVLPFDHSEPFPPQPRACTPWTSPLCLSTHSCWAPGPGTEQAPCCPQGSPVDGAEWVTCCLLP